LLSARVLACGAWGTSLGRDYGRSISSIRQISSPEGASEYPAAGNPLAARVKQLDLQSPDLQSPFSAAKL
jgi:hypothetical protein